MKIKVAKTLKNGVLITLLNPPVKLNEEFLFKHFGKNCVQVSIPPFGFSTMDGPYNLTSLFTDVDKLTELEWNEIEILE